MSAPADQPQPPAAPVHLALAAQLISAPERLPGAARQALRWLTDEELYRLALYWWRRQVTLDETAQDILAGVLPELSLSALLIHYDLITNIRANLAAEERFRERARARGVPRDGGRDWVPDDVLAEVKRRTDLGALVERYTGVLLSPPKGRHQRRWACCPFHEERHASFCVWTADDGEQHWQCFGACHEGGDVIAFVRRWATWLSFRDAVAGLASAAGVNWPPAEPGQGRYLAMAREAGSDG